MAQFHYTPPKGWMNDPNGLIYHAGAYHLFYQHFPHGSSWGPMHWGHAYSRDLVTWTDAPIALYPTDAYHAFSGCVVYDGDNTSGFAKNDSAPLVALFTMHDPAGKRAETRAHESQGLALSFDDGQTWVLPADNRVLANPGNTPDFRDPNVFWHDASKRWIMALAVGNRVEFYGSPDLAAWTRLSAFACAGFAENAVAECPNLVEIADREGRGTHWLLIVSFTAGGPQRGSGSQYFVGEFDGSDFNPYATYDPSDASFVPHWLDHGPDNYAGLCWLNAPVAPHQKICIGWMNNWAYMPTGGPLASSGSMTLPRVLELTECCGQMVLSQRPILAFDALDAESVQDVPSDMNQHWIDIALPTTDGCLDITVAAAPGETLNSFTLTLRWANGHEAALGFDTARNHLHTERYLDRGVPIPGDLNSRFEAQRRVDSPLQAVRAVVSSLGVELFADGGQTVMTMRHTAGGLPIAIAVTADDARVKATVSHKRASV